MRTESRPPPCAPGPQVVTYPGGKEPPPPVSSPLGNYILTQDQQVHTNRSPGEDIGDIESEGVVSRGVISVLRLWVHRDTGSIPKVPLIGQMTPRAGVVLEPDR